MDELVSKGLVEFHRFVEWKVLDVVLDTYSEQLFGICGLCVLKGYSGRKVRKLIFLCFVEIGNVDGILYIYHFQISNSFKDVVCMEVMLSILMGIVEGHDRDDT